MVTAVRRTSGDSSAPCCSSCRQYDKPFGSYDFHFYAVSTVTVMAAIACIFVIGMTQSFQGDTAAVSGTRLPQYRIHLRCARVRHAGPFPQ